MLFLALSFHIFSAYERGDGEESQSARFGTVGGRVSRDSPNKPQTESSGKNYEVVVAYKGPCVLPWLWKDIKEDGDILLSPQPITFRAGPEGRFALSRKITF